MTRSLVLFGSVLAFSFGLNAGEAKPVEQSEWRAEFISADSEKKIEGLTWESPVQVTLVPKGLSFQPLAHLKGTFLRPGQALIFEKKWLNKPAKTKTELLANQPVPISVDIVLNGEITPIQFQVIGPNGELENQKYVLRFESWEQAIHKTTVRPKRRTYFFSSLGPSHVTYREMGISNYEMVALTAKASCQFLLFPPHWDMAFSAFMNLVPIARSGPDANARFFGLNLKFGYVVPQVKAPWRLSLLVGWYYTRMIVERNAFGYHDLIWPQFFPAVSRELESGNLLTFNAKYAPMMTGVNLAGPKSFEWALGAGYVRFLETGHPISFNMDYSKMSLVMNKLNIQSSSFSLSAGYGW